MVLQNNNLLLYIFWAIMSFPVFTVHFLINYLKFLRKSCWESSKSAGQYQADSFLLMIYIMRDFNRSSAELVKSRSPKYLQHFFLPSCPRYAFHIICVALPARQRTLDRVIHDLGYRWKNSKTAACYESLIHRCITVIIVQAEFFKEV